MVSFTFKTVVFHGLRTDFLQHVPFFLSCLFILNYSFLPLIVFFLFKCTDPYWYAVSAPIMYFLTTTAPFLLTLYFRKCRRNQHKPRANEDPKAEWCSRSYDTVFGLFSAFWFWVTRGLTDVSTHLFRLTTSTNINWPSECFVPLPASMSLTCAKRDGSTQTILRRNSWASRHLFPVSLVSISKTGKPDHEIGTPLKGFCFEDFLLWKPASIYSTSTLL